jgi:galactokinase/mevalonate kinase-like predicted kinase
VIRSALEAMVGIAHDMAEALPAGDLARIGGLMSRNWIHQQALDPAMATPAMTALEQAARVAGTLGGKAAGSGAGGCMIFLAGDEVEAVRQAARAMGAVLLPVRWASAGVRTW